MVTSPVSRPLDVVVAQIPVSWTVEDNLRRITEVLSRTRPGDLVVLPEGALSGYGDDLSPLEEPSRAQDVDRAAGRVAELARRHQVHVFCGSLVREGDAWWNAALHFGPDGGRWEYRKVNLAMHERGRLEAGNRLEPLRLSTPSGDVTVGVQLCREIRFPEQWRHLVDAGADVLVYLTYAANPNEPAGVWRSHLVSRAAENQRFVLACNVADPLRHCPSMVVSPRGEVLAEAASAATELLRTTIDVSLTSDWYLGQRRDLARL